MPRSYSRRRARKGGDSAQIIDLQSKVEKIEKQLSYVCLLYTSDAADE